MIRTCSLAAVAAMAAVIGSGAATAGTIAPSAVKIDDGKVEASLTGKPGNAADGKKWFVNRKLGNCLACHANSDTSDEQFHGEVGPPLDGVGEVRSEAELRAIIVNSKAVFGDGTIMPAFYRTEGLYRARGKFAEEPILTAQQVEDVVAYLLTLKD